MSFFQKKKLLLFLIIFLPVLLLFGFFIPWQPKTKPPLTNPVVNPPFTLIVLPDTQIYSQNQPEIFQKQTQWIVDQKEKLNIVFVSHVGDIVQSRNLDFEWQNANRAISILDDKVPYGLLPGNHDGLEKFNEYFPYTRYQNEKWYGGHFSSTNNNNYQFFSSGRFNFIILHLENNPSEKVLEWADKILKDNYRFQAIVVSHYILDFDGQRSLIGERIYSTLKDNPNLFLMLCGHAHVEARRTDNVDGRPIYELLADYQVRPNGGDGWLRILKFIPDQNQIQVQTYSPFLDKYETDENSEFNLSFR